jgi:type I restriction enzyme S subunit
MIAELKPYPEYKDSGQEWLGHVPSHWEVRRTKFLLREMDSRSVTGREQLLRVSQYTGVTQRKSADGSDAPDTRAASLKGYKVVCKNDLVINIMLAWNGSMGVSRFDGIVSPAYCVYRLNLEVMPWYFHELLRLPTYKGRIKSASTGVVESRLRLYSDDLGCIEALLPPPDEQSAIVRFLDHWNGRLEKAIRSKRRVIALLQEQKQAIIHRAVTRGLDPNVKLKDSAIPWLGEIPAHWEVRRMGSAIKLITGFPFKSEGFSQSESSTRLLRGINVTPNGLRWDSTVGWERTSGDGLDDFALEVGDIVLGMDRPIIASGIRASRVESKDVPSLLLQRVARLRPKVELDGNFLLLLLKGKLFADYMAPIFTGISVPHLSPEQIRSFKVMLPPLSEQVDIVRHVAHETSTLTTAIARFEREITLLREYRTRLTADVVTGKLDVRAAAAQLPEPAPDEPLPDPEIPEEEAELEEVEE